jgi:hypothetical protein
MPRRRARSGPDGAPRNRPIIALTYCELAGPRGTKKAALAKGNHANWRDRSMIRHREPVMNLRKRAFHRSALCLYRAGGIRAAVGVGRRCHLMITATGLRAASVRGAPRPNRPPHRVPAPSARRCNRSATGRARVTRSPRRPARTAPPRLKSDWSGGPKAAGTSIRASSAMNHGCTKQNAGV